MPNVVPAFVSQGLEIHAVSGLMHRVSQNGKLSSGWPDIAVLFNSGIGSIEYSKVASWLATLTMLIQTNAAILLTCGSKSEAGLMMRLLAEPYKAVVNLSARENAMITEEMISDGLAPGNAWLMWIQGTNSRSTLQGAVARAEDFVKGLAGDAEKQAGAVEV